LPETSVFLQGDKEWLYVAFRCEEPDLENTRRDWLWSEGVEVYLDPLHDHETFLHVGVTPDCTSGIEFSGLPRSAAAELRLATSADVGAWIVEMAIPSRSVTGMARRFYTRETRSTAMSHLSCRIETASQQASGGVRSGRVIAFPRAS